MRIVLTGGGTGGHVTPFEPIVEALRQTYPTEQAQLPGRVDPKELTIQFLGVADETTREFFERLDIGVVNIPSGRVRRYASSATIIDIVFRLPIGLLVALLRLWQIMPDVVISKGGYGSIPIVLAAAFYRIPLIVHESDVKPGSANRLATRFATTVVVGWQATKKALAAYARKVAVVGIPVRSHFGQRSSEQAKVELGLTPNTPAVAVIGGSQGARQLNEALLQVLAQLIGEAAVLHVTGSRGYDAVATVAKETLATLSRADQYKVWPYVTHEMDTILSAADLVVSRAGATALAELARLKKPVLLVPLPADVSDNQQPNAAVLEAAGAAQVLDSANLGANIFLHSIRELLADSERRQQLGERLAQFDRPAAAADIAEIVFTLARGSAPVYAT